MKLPFVLPAAAAACLLAPGVVAAAATVLYSQAPEPGFNGIQSDASTGTYLQSFVVAPDATLDMIEWYGYHLPGGLGPGSDAFTVLLNGVDVTASALSLNSSVLYSSGGVDFYRYTLNVTDIPLSSGTLELMNGPDTQWAWQFSDAIAETTAFTLLGPAAAVPEPAGAALALLALLGLAQSSRGNAAKGRRQG